MKSSTRALLLLILLAGASLRLFFLLASQWMVEGDEAAVGLQAMQIVRGDRPIFFPGQTYLGNLESYLVAGVFALLGASPVTLRVVPFVYALAFILLSYRLGRELFRSESAGLAAALCAAVAPAYGIMWSVKARGGFIEGLVLIQLALLWFNRWLAPEPTPSKASGRSTTRPARWLAGLVFAFICGYTVWTSPLVVYVLVPVAVLLLVHVARNLRGWVPAIRPVICAAAGGLFGLLPWLIARQVLGPQTFGRFRNDLPLDEWPPLVAQVWQYMWHDGLPAILGLRLPRALFEPDWRFVVLPICAAALICLLWQAGRSPGAQAMALMGFTAFPVFAYGSITGGNFAVIIPDSGLLTRYLLPLYVLYSVSAGVLLGALRPVLRIAALAVILSVNVWSIISVDPIAYARNEFSNQPLPPNYADVIDFLTREDLHYVYTNHWIGYPLMFESREQIVAFDYTQVRYDLDRFPRYAPRVEAAERPALLVFSSSHEENPIDGRLKELAVWFEKHALTNFIVYYDFAPRLHPSSLEDVLVWPYY